MGPKKKGGKTAKGNKPTKTDAPPKEDPETKLLQDQLQELKLLFDQEKAQCDGVEAELNNMKSLLDRTTMEIQKLTAEEEHLDQEKNNELIHHHDAIVLCKEEVKNLLYEDKSKTDQMIAHGSVSIEAKQKQHDQLQARLHNELRSIMVDIEEQNADNLEKTHDRLYGYEHEIAKTKAMRAKMLEETKAKYEEKMKLVPEKLKRMWKEMESERQASWKAHTLALTADNKKLLIKMDADAESIRRISEENKSLQKTLKHTRMEQKEKRQDAVYQTCQHLTELLMNFDEEIKRIQNEEKNSYCGLERGTFEKLKKKKLQNLQSEYEEMKQKRSMLLKERNEIQSTFDQKIKAVHDKQNVEIEILENEEKRLIEALTDTPFSSMFSSSISKLNQAALCDFMTRTETNLNSHAAQRHLPSKTTGIKTATQLPAFGSGKSQSTRQPLKRDKQSSNRFPLTSTKKTPVRQRCGESSFQSGRTPQKLVSGKSQSQPTMLKHDKQQLNQIPPISTRKMVGLHKTFLVVTGGKGL